MRLRLSRALLWLGVTGQLIKKCYVRTIGLRQLRPTLSQQWLPCV